MGNDQLKENEAISDREREDWSIKKIADESTNQSPDDLLRQFLRGDETKGDADERDVVGSSASIDTPQGREEAKKDKGRDS